jgi:hypothetical protein
VTAPNRLERLRRRLTGAGPRRLHPAAHRPARQRVPAAGRGALAWLTGFTGSAGQAVVLRIAAVFTDGRYTVQIGQEVDGDLFERCNVTDRSPTKLARGALRPGMVLGYDPKLTRKAERQGWNASAAIAAPSSGPRRQPDRRHLGRPAAAAGGARSPARRGACRRGQCRQAPAHRRAGGQARGPTGSWSRPPTASPGS